METIKTITALAITFGLLGGFVWLLRFLSSAKGGRTMQWHRKPQERHLQSIETLVLAPDCTLHLVAFDDEKLLLAISSKAVVTIHSNTNHSKALHAAGGAA